MRRALRDCPVFAAPAPVAARLGPRLLAGLLLLSPAAGMGAQQLELAPERPVEVAITVGAGQVREVTLRQEVGLSRLSLQPSLQPSLQDGEGLRYMSDAGRGSVIRLLIFGPPLSAPPAANVAPLAASPLASSAAGPAQSGSASGLASGPLSGLAAGPASLRSVLMVATRERRRSSTADLNVGPARDATAADRQRADFDQKLARADLLRRAARPDGCRHAEVLLEEALAAARALGEPALERRALVGRARLMTYCLEDYQEGLAASARAVRIPAAGDDAEQALAWKSYASSLSLLNRYGEAEAAARRALELYRRTGDRYWQGVVLGNLAYTYREQGQSGRALEAAGQALAIAGEEKDDYGIAFSYAAEGSIYQGRGDYQNAIDCFHHALDVVARTPYPQVEGEVWSDLGRLYAELADWEQAENAYQRALPALVAGDDGVSEIDARGRLAAVELHAGKAPQAAAEYRAALERAEKQQLLRSRASLLAGLGRTEAALGHAALARQLLEQARAGSRAIGQLEDQADAEDALGDLEFGAGSRRAASASYARAAALWQQVPNPVEQARSLANLARVDFACGRLERAREEIFSAIAQVEHARATLVSGRLRTSYFSSRHAFYELAIDILMSLDDEHGGAGRPYARQALEVAERARARTLLDELAAAPGAAGRSEQQQALDLQIAEAEERLAHIGTGGEEDGRAGQAAGRLHGLMLEAARLEEVSARAPGTDGWPGIDAGRGGEAARLPEADPGTTLCEYWTGRSRSFLWVVSARGLAVYRLPAQARLAAAVRSYRALLLAREQTVAGEDLGHRRARIERADGALGEAARALGALLLPAATARGRRLAVVADGPLLGLPFAALRPAWAQGAYLAETRELLEEPSLAVLGELQSRPRPAGGRLVAVFADPVYTSADARLRGEDRGPAAIPVRLRQAGEKGLPELPRLPGTRREATRIEAIAGPGAAVLHLDFDASPATLASTDWQGYRVLHLAAHALANQQAPELSGIALSMVRADGSRVNGVLRLHELEQMRIPVELVVLSACGSASGRLVSGEGLMGLSRAFLIAGAHSVLGSLWTADDASSAQFMEEFYTSLLKNGNAAPAALRSAQLHLLRTPRYGAPYYWAGMVMEGAWREP